MAIVEFSPEARLMLLEADERWGEEHGFDIDNPLVADISHAVKLLERNAQLGVLYRRARGKSAEIRRMLLSTGWHLYYTVSENHEHVSVVAIWFAARRAPRL